LARRGRRGVSRERVAAVVDAGLNESLVLAEYFMCCVECLSNRLWCTPCKDKTSGSWESAVTRMLEENMSEIRVIVSDRDAAATSEKFRRSILERHSISWYFLPLRSKAHRAELMIRYVKSHLSMALKANPGSDWRKYLSEITEAHNREVIPGTNVVRNAVNESNYLTVLGQLYRTKDPDALFPLSSGENYSPGIAALLWQRKVGDRVLVERKLQLKLKKRTFDKASMVGSWGDEVFVVRKRMLKSNAGLFLVPAYRVGREEGGYLPGFYYDSNLLHVGF
jgi:hypothetical protein